MGMTVYLDGQNKYDVDEDFDKELLAIIRDALEKEAASESTHIFSPKRVNEFMDACRSVHKHFPSTKYHVETRKCDLSVGGWDICIKGESIEFDDPKEIADTILRLADNFEVSSDLDGSVEFNLAFYGLTEKIR